MRQHFAFSMLKGTPARKKVRHCRLWRLWRICKTIHIYKNQPTFITLCWCIKLELFFCYQRFLPARSLLTILKLFCFLPKILQNIRSSVWVVVVGLLYKFHKCHRVNPSSEQRADNITLREREKIRHRNIFYFHDCFLILNCFWVFSWWSFLCHHKLFLSLL